MRSSSPDTDNRPLAGLLVVDLTSSVAGQYTGRLLAMYGAVVVLVEPPDGTATRRMPPLDPAGGDSYLFRHLNQGKRSVVVDRAVEQTLLADLLDRADVVLRDQGDALPVELADTVVDCDLGDFPPDTGYAAWQGTELIHQALSGVMNATGVAERQPIYGVGHRASYATGTTAYITVLAALHERRRSGLGQRVHATVFESVAAMGQNLVSQFSYNATAETRARYPGYLAMLRCRDEWIVLFAIRNWPGLCQVFGLDELVRDPRFATQAGRLANWPEVTDLLRNKASRMSSDDVVAACQANRISAEKVSGLGELATSQQWRVRSMLHEVTSGDGVRSEVALHRLFHIDGADFGVPSASPALGADQVSLAISGRDR